MKFYKAGDIFILSYYFCLNVFLGTFTGIISFEQTITINLFFSLYFIFSFICMFVFTKNRIAFIGGLKQKQKVILLLSTFIIVFCLSETIEILQVQGLCRAVLCCFMANLVTFFLLIFRSLIKKTYKTIANILLLFILTSTLVGIVGSISILFIR